MNKRLGSIGTVVVAALAFAVNLGAAPAAGPSADRDIAAIAKKVSPSVVRVEARNGVRRVATGVVIDRDGLIVTTALISPRQEKITVVTGEGKRIEAEFLGFDPETHLAVIRAKDKGLPPLALGETGRLDPGSWVSVISISPEMTPAVAQGIVSSASEERLRLNIWVTPGSSGGAVVDEDGRMVGLLRGSYAEDRPVVFEYRGQEQVGTGLVLSQGEASSSGMAVAVPLDVVRDIVAEIKDKGKVERGWIGMSIGQQEDERVVVVVVEDESPASLAKLKEGDVVLAIDGKDVATTAKLASIIRKHRPGDDVVVRVERDGKPMDVKVKLGEVPKSEAWREMELKFPRLFPPGAPEPEPEPFAGPKRIAPRAPRAPLAPREFSWERRKFIGVYLNELTPELSAHFGAKEGSGLQVNRLTAKGPAEKAGLRVGDVIVKAEGKPVGTVGELSAAVQDKKKGDKIKLEILRDKKPLTVEVAVEEEESGGIVSWNMPLSPENQLRLQTYVDAARTYADKAGKALTDDAQGGFRKIETELSELARKSGDAAKAFTTRIARAIRRI